MAPCGVASTASPLERFNRFLKCCRINLLKLYGSSAWLCSTDTRGRFQSRRFVVPSSVPPRRGRADCLRPMRRRLSIPHAVIRSRCFSLLSPTSRYDERGGVCGASRCFPDGAEDGAGGFAVACHVSCVMCHVLVPLLALRASDRPPPCRSFVSPPCRSFVSPPLARSVSSWHRRSPVLIMPACPYRPA